MSESVAIEVRHVRKGFQVPSRTAVSARDRLAHPLRSSRARELGVLEDVSFDVHRGEFFGVVGRNGSGKSTLLKLLASIYRADGGTIRVAGRLAPFIELGVGFNPQLAALDNVVLNGVMMGLTPTEARRRYEEIVAFAGLERFTDLKLKNYSSGMKVRLGFSVMTHVDADVLLIDEVLAVGDSAFREKCGDVFARMHDEGKTIVLVSHDMLAINRYCDRAMLLNDGQIERVGDPGEVSNRYLELNAARKLLESEDGRPDGRDGGGEFPARVVELRLGGATATAEPAFEQGEPLDFEALVEFDDGLARPGLRFRVQDGTGRDVFVAPLQALDSADDAAAGRRRLRVSGRIENRLAPGRYVFVCRVFDTLGRELPLSPLRWANFAVAGSADKRGIVALDYDVSVQPAFDAEVSQA
jgi:ABC-2 type transport system ATP-binding protein